MKKTKLKSYYILRINCDCCSSKEARTNLPRGICGSAKCKHCGKMLGLMEWEVVDKVKALGEIDALHKFNLTKTTTLERKNK